MRLLYLVHDLDDPAVRRRCRFLREGGAHVSVVGFRRHKEDASRPPAEGREIGRTWNGRLFRRIATALRAATVPDDWHRKVAEADVVLTRSLEMLLVAVLVRGRRGPGVPVVYECLDIHRLMTRTDAIGKGMRWLERRLLASCALLVVSSPRFIDAYFRRHHPRLGQWALLENKLLGSEFEALTASPSKAVAPCEAVPVGPPWRIGWFGIIRCRRSLELLSALVRGANGAVEVEIRGLPARDVVPEFDQVIAATEGLSFGGAYDRATDLPSLYGRVHFTWAIDFYEAGLNSAWLLPNRLYEGSAFGSVPLALREVETGRWLADHGCGLLLDPPLERALPALFAAMTAAAFENARQRVVRLDPGLFTETPDTAAAFVAMLGRLRISVQTATATTSFVETT